MTGTALPLRGASKELFEAILINPFDKNAMADALLKAITMPVEEQKQRNFGMQKRRADTMLYVKQLLHNHGRGKLGVDCKACI